ncbi:hypothetical protein F4809DRAFT_652035 [Biscogniauxia mediterranea]|nr:hypothetical protein F4809DRAFT_652035 [Biscogniauxia mediterranea]
MGEENQKQQELAFRLMHRLVHDYEAGFHSLGINPRAPPGGNPTRERLIALYEKGKPFYTKDVFVEIETKLVTLNLSLNDPTITFKAIDGSEAKRVFTERTRTKPNTSLMVQVHDYQDMLDLVRYNWHNDAVRDSAMSPISFSVIRHRPRNVPLGKDYWKLAFASAKDAWQETAACKKVFAALEKAGKQVANVESIVCFGLSSLTRDITGTPVAPRSATKYAAVVLIAKYISERLGKKIFVHSQEPFADDITIHLLREHGIFTYEGHIRFTHGYIELNDNALVVSISPGSPVRSVVADIARPPIMICNGYFKGGRDEELKFWESQGSPIIPATFDPVTPRVRAMLENDYHEHPIVGEMNEKQSDKDPFARVFVYVRKDQNEEAEKGQDKGKGKEVVAEDKKEDEDSDAEMALA